MNRRRIAAIVALDALVLAELALAMYAAHGHEQEFTSIFLKVFFGLLIPTLVAGRFALRMVR